MNKLKRRHLPNYAIVDGKNFDLGAVRQLCEHLNLFDFENYTDIMLSSDSKMTPYLKAYSDCREAFFTEAGANYLEGTSYRQKYLTEPNFSSAEISQFSHSVNTKEKLRRLKPGAHQNPLVDETQYTIRNKLVQGVFEEILDSFKSPVTRVRLAYLAPQFAIKPHIDADTSLIMRYHLPILTNDRCLFHIERNGAVETKHLPADGRLYFVNAGFRHWAANNSDLPRLHLIIDTSDQFELNDLVPF